ncbi:hypothetical protein QTU67_001442 [Vibrio cholerae]|uniref:hypothetical protein n=1 Tax=Vibrio cholerae TaxID=666 RepID=UPI0011D480D7|nr:hypothetical protein [Vibrio cholerae]EGQ7789050.1 hypothetical protein [Vibrio cholerae]EGQ8096556.1 hypothetical protein [Vibrio cholerae]EGR0263235.1 hypothetical protein [Vibrio cholerae]EGR0785453.1 hypothetical protein [Vibrio cholerae]EGR1129477.1 hypothetical protein [Vibrio cholerae]
MANFNKSDMKYNDYSWTVYGNDDPKVRGVPDSTLFSRKEGYEVLYMVNKVLDKKGLSSSLSGQKAEKMIHDHLPGTTRSQKNVFDWLIDNWSKY